MAVLLIYLSLAVGVIVTAAPQQHQYTQQAALQQINPLDYYVENPELNYYNPPQTQQKSENTNDIPSRPSRLENLEPDSEVEIIAGGQQPQQPPQQNPISPNIPGLAPGQRVFIVHMPVAGYRPGSIGGYQPVYIVAAAPQANNAYPANGVQNAIILGPGGQPLVQPVLGYTRSGLVGGQQGNPGYLLGSPFAVNRPFDFGYQNPNVAFQPGSPSQVEGIQGPFRLGQLGIIRGQPNQPNTSQAIANESPVNTNPKRVGQADDSVESKENATSDETRRSSRPNLPKTQARNKN